MPDSPDVRIAVDPSALDGLRRFGGDDLLRKLVLLFREQMRIRGEAMRSAAAKGDAQAARQAAHALKSSAAQLGATGLRDICQRVESAAIDGDTAAFTSAIAEIDTAIPIVDAWLTDRGFPPEP